MADQMTSDQERAASVLRAARESGQAKIAGYAGTGKTWLAVTALPGILAGRKTAYAAPTNKAANRLRDKLREQGYRTESFPSASERAQDGWTDQISVGTIFRLLHLPDQELLCRKTGKAVRNEFEPCKPCRQAGQAKPCNLTEGELRKIPLDDPLRGLDAVVIDEGSMLGNKDWLRLAELTLGKRTLIIFGDPMQLPPIDDEGPPGWNAMNDADITMTGITRQAAGSPVIQLAHAIRLGHKPVPGSYGDLAVLQEGRPPDWAVTWAARHAASDGYMIITAPHRDADLGRQVLNSRSRAACGLAGEPHPGEPVVAADSDYFTWKAVNSERGLILEAGEPFRWDGLDVTEMSVRFGSHRDPRRFLALRDQFGNPDWGMPGGGRKIRSVAARPSVLNELRRLDRHTGAELKILRTGREPLVRLDYGYALTAWKAQGDEAPGVLAVRYPGIWWAPEQNYDYTSVTRSRQYLVVS